VVMQQRTDAMRPRILKLWNWLAMKYPEVDWSRDSEEIRAAECLFNARFLDYINGGPDEPVKEAILIWGRAHIR
jgi:hypothetical protein